MNAMIDLETLGVRAGAIVVSVGVVKFTKEGPVDSFYAVLNRAEQDCLGMSIDPSTVDWWTQQSADARKVFEQTPSPVVPELQRLSAFMANVKQVWAGPAAFDFPILGALYDRFEVRRPWSYKDERCYSTVRKTVAPDVPAPEFMGVAHHALDDALHQAHHLLAIAETVPGLLG